MDDIPAMTPPRPDAGGFPVLSRHAFEQQKVRGVRPSYPRQISQREFDNRNNRRRSHWNLGDSVMVSGVEYEVGHIQDTGHMWTLRLDRKYAASVYLRVPK